MLKKEFFKTQKSKDIVKEPIDTLSLLECERRLKNIYISEHNSNKKESFKHTVFKDYNNIFDTIENEINEKEISFLNIEDEEKSIMKSLRKKRDIIMRSLNKI